jgi:hypothetical protein
MADRQEMSASSPETPGASFSEVSGSYSYYVLGVLSLVYVFNFIDRQVLAMLVQPIKDEFGVSDTSRAGRIGARAVPSSRWRSRCGAR